MRSAAFLLVIAMLLPNPARAQEPPPFDARETVGTILLGGLVGGVLGLSTLSFYKRPQDNIRNITIGAGTGMILSALYLTFNLASNPRTVGPSAASKTSMIQPWADGERAGLLLTKTF